jgi:phosphoglycolate phosphatase-like HAD superfamily hydrolase
VTVICFGKTSGLTGVNVQIEEMDLSANDDGMTQRRVRRVLGDFAHSVSTTGLVNQSIAQEFAGERRRALEEAPHVSAHGWYAIAFDETDLRGVYVLGDAEFLEPNLLQDVTDPQLAASPGEDTPEETGLRGLAGRFAGAFRRGKQETDAQEEETEGRENDTPSTVDRLENDQPAAESGRPQTELQLAPTEMAEKPSYFKGLLQRAQSALSRADGPNDQSSAETDADRERELYRLLFAYLPEPTSLHNADGSPNLPSDLIPLCHLRLVEQVREEAIDAIQTLTEEGVEIKILSSAPVKAVAATAVQLGLGTGDASELDVVSGRDLEEMDSSHFAQAVTENVVFGNLAPEQTGQIVQALRDQGETVAMVGDGVNHVTALRNANVKITIQSASQVALSIADIVLLNDSLAVLSQVMKTGQRIVNGMLDMLKLSMTQVFYMAIFLTVTLFIGFPYAPEQGTFINIFTLSLPAMGLSLWAATGAKPISVQSSRIRHFVFPAAVTMSVAALGINFLFRTTTGDMAYAQLATAYTIVACGLLLVVFVQPPTKAWVGGDVLNGDKRHPRMVLLLLIAFVVISPFPPAMRFLNTAPLRQLSDYGVIGLGVLCWAIVLRTIWRSRFLRGGLQLNDDAKGQFREHDAGLEMVR